MSLSQRRLQQLLEQLDFTRPTRPRETRPAWMLGLLDHVCEWLEPMRGEARVGYEVTQEQDYWSITVFVGTTEIVGGVHDGRTDYVSFRVDICGIARAFDSISRSEWVVVPTPSDWQRVLDHSFFVLDGIWQGQAVRLTITATPPEEMGPGMRKYPDGRCELS